jgi:hypothetical protein
MNIIVNIVLHLGLSITLEVLWIRYEIDLTKFFTGHFNYQTSHPYSSFILSKVMVIPSYLLIIWLNTLFTKNEYHVINNNRTLVTVHEETNKTVT